MIVIIVIIFQIYENDPEVDKLISRIDTRRGSKMIERCSKRRMLLAVAILGNRIVSHKGTAVRRTWPFTKMPNFFYNPCPLLQWLHGKQQQHRIATGDA